MSNYWEGVRGQYAAFESGLPAPASEVYLHEMPGGQFTNLKAQARRLGLEERWHEVAQAYADANQMFGDIVKVTPSSKVVGDMALMMVAQGLTRAQVEDPAVDVAFPEFGGRHAEGQPWPTAWRLARGHPEEGAEGRNAADRPPRRRHGRRSIWRRCAPSCRDRACNGFEAVDDEDLNGYLMYPKVFLDYRGRHRVYGPVRALPTRTFFYGMEPGEEITAEIDPGKTLEIRLQAVGETTDDGEVQGVLRTERPAPRDPRAEPRDQGQDRRQAQGGRGQPRPYRRADAGG